MSSNRLSATAAAFAVALVAPGLVHAARPTYASSATVKTLDVDPPGVTCSSTPGSCFKLHWVETTTDAPSTTDSSPANGRPDYIDQLATVVSDVFNKEVTTMGWTAPPSDGSSSSNGGDGRIDVYVKNVSCSGGIAFVQNEGAVSPGSKRWYSYVVVDHDLKALYSSSSCANSGPGDLSTLSQLQVIEDVFAHEYNHVLQFGINKDSRAGFKEATANWMNDEVYDDINANVRSSSLGDFTLFTTPATSLDTISYGGWFWLRYLSERFGRDFVRSIWSQLGSATDNDDTATATVLAANGSSLRQAWVDFAAKLYAKQTFEEGSTWPDINPTGVSNASSPHNAYPVTTQTRTLSHLARSYILFQPQASSLQRLLTLTVNGPDGQDSGADAVSVMADARRVPQAFSFNSTNDGGLVVSGFGAAPPPSLTSVRAASVVLVLANATASTDGLSFSYCSPSCTMGGGADPMITPWGYDFGGVEPLWQTPDVWVDNDGDCQPDTSGRPGCDEPDDPATSAVDAEPTRGRINTLFARVRNLGDQPVTNATVTLSYAPFGVALPSRTFAPIGSQTVNLAAAGSPGDTATVSVPWDLTDLTFNNGGNWDVPSTPAVETTADFDHFCVQVQISYGPDVNTANNLAQNNFGNIPVQGTGRTERVMVGNPDDNGHSARLQLSRPLPKGYALKLAGGLTFDRPFRLHGNEIRLVTVTFSGPAGSSRQPIFADLTLFLDGVARGGISVNLAGP